MSEDDKQSKPFFGDSWLGRVLRGEEKVKFSNAEAPELPKLRETAHMDEKGLISLSVSWYGLDGSRGHGDTVCDNPESPGYKAVLSRHPDLAPHKPSTYEEYHDGRWELSRRNEILAAGNIGHGPDQQSETEKRRAAG